MAFTSSCKLYTGSLEVAWYKRQPGRSWTNFIAEIRINLLNVGLAHLGRSSTQSAAVDREERRRSVTQRTHQLDASRFKRWSNADPGEGIAPVMTGPDLEIIGPGESNPPARSDEDSECRLLTFKRFRTFANFIITWTFLNFLDLYNEQFELYNWSATLLTRHYMMSQKVATFIFTITSATVDQLS